MFCRSGSYEQAHELVLAATGVSIGKRQLEQITAAGRRPTRSGSARTRAARDRELPAPGRTGTGRSRPPLAISADGKGVAMRPEARRRTGQGPGPAGPDLRAPARHRGEEGHKRMAETGCGVRRRGPGRPARAPRSRSCTPIRAPGPPAPRAVNRWYACDITAGRDVTIGKVFDEAEPP